MGLEVGRLSADNGVMEEWDDMAFAACEELSDRAIVERAQRGDHRAFTELVGRHDRRLRTLAGRLLQNPERVDDALQEVYMKAFRTIGRFRGDANVGTWLYRITYNTCVDELRRRQPVRVNDDFDPPSIEPGPAERYAAASEVAHMLDRLSPELRATVVLVDGYGLGYADASRLLDVAPGTVASRLHRARQHLRGATQDAA
jgi:RNA polymerase sigma-70 factor (ECF subfamily)